MNNLSPDPIVEQLAARLAEVERKNTHLTQQLTDLRTATTYSHHSKHIGGRPLLHLMKIIVIACLLVVALSTGVLASSATTSTIYYACVNNKTGSITIVSQTTICKKGYRKIQWNQAGPQGPSNSYTAVLKSDVIIPTQSVPVVTVSSLPPGNYTVIANASVSWNGSQYAWFECSLSPDTNTPVPVIDGGVISYTTSSIPISINDSMSNFSGGSISLTCVTMGAAGNSTIVTSAQAQITAIQVGTVTHN
jgi:hypothetical protein